MTVVAEMSLWVALLMTGWAVIVSVVGGAAGRAELVTSGERGLHAVLLLLAVAAAGLWAALFARDFSVAYVASHTSANLPSVYTISAFWAGRGGSLLLWTLILSGLSVIVLRTSGRVGSAVLPFVAAALAAVMLSMIASLLFTESPFARLSWSPPEGLGMSPQLQRLEMVFYLPVLYVGYAATAVPFALASGALVTRRFTPELLASARRWALVAWFVTTVAILIGMHWAYGDPGRGGRWAWHAVESASLLPWLALSAFLLSAAVQWRRGVVRKWSIVLMMSAFLLAIFATLSPGSGVITGVHPLVQSAGGIWIMGAVAAAIVIAGVLVIDRLGDVDVALPAAPVRAAGTWRRRSGAYLLSVGAIGLAAGLAAQAFRTEHGTTLQPGETAEVADPFGGEWQFVVDGVSRYLILNRRVTAATISVYRGDAPPRLVTTERRQHVDGRGAPLGNPSTEPGLLRTAAQDVHAVLAAVRGEDEVALRISFNPVVWLVWFGGAVGAIGGLFAMWPPRDQELAATAGAGIPR